ncbi:MAG: recombinase RecT, partial [Proteobacteria bacterium]|nr:recombinase RecT [Pseudomonadota bacterium]
MAETQLTVTQQKAMSLREYLESPNIQRQITSALPKWLTPERFFRVLFSSILKNPKIMDCTRESILISVMQCAQLGLEPILGRAHLIPYENSKKINGQWIKVLECQFQPGYQGLVDLARRSGEVKDVFSMVVYEKDIFDIEYGTNRRLVHKPYLKEEPGDPIGAYTVWEMKDGVKNFEFMPLHDLYKRRAKSQAYLYAIANPDNKKAQECPWVQWPEEQMKKTVTKHHSKLQPASIEYMQAAELDDMAEIGAPQSGFFLPSGRGMAQIEAPGPDPATLIASFDEQFGEEVKPFIKTLADHYKKTEDEIKIEAMKDTAGFTKGFVTWKAKQKPTKVYTQAPEVMRGPEPEPITYTPKPEKEPERIEKAG